jgi:transcriptional regulator with XRE-family HTH domain
MTWQVMIGRRRTRYRSRMVSFGTELKRWRTARRLSQEALAFDAEISTRHLSFLEGGKSQPSRQMVLVLASALDLPLRERNTLLLSAGFAPAYRSSPLDGDEGAEVRAVLHRILEKHEPYPAVVYDRAGDVVLMNNAASRLLPLFIADPGDERAARNVHHALLSPAGVRPFVVDWPAAAAFLVERLRKEVAAGVDGDPLAAVLTDVLKYDGVPREAQTPPAHAGPYLSFHLVRGDVAVRLFSALTTLGTPLDVTAQELTIESFFPADASTAAFLEKKHR